MFLTINGTGLTGAVSTAVSFTSPEDPPSTYTLEPSTIRPDGTRLVVFVPEVVTTIAGSWEVRVLATDTTETRTIGPATLTVIDRNAGPPIITVPEFLFFPATTSEGAVVTYEASAVSASTGEEVPVDCTPASETQFSFGFTTVTCTATEGEFTSTAGFRVLVWDFTAPVITVPDHHIMTNDPVVTYEVSAVDDIDGPVETICRPASGTTFRQGTTRVVCIATDSHANSGFETFLVTVTEGGRPAVDVPDDITVEATGPSGAVVTYEVETHGGTAPANCTPASGSTFPLGFTTVSCTASNAFGSTTETFTVLVVDTTGPEINAPDINAEATSAAGALVSWDVTATDLVQGSVPVLCYIPTTDETDPIVVTSPRQFAIGQYTIECTASDSLGNAALESFIITVADTTPPMVTATANPSTLSPPNHKMVAVTITVVASDIVDPAPVSQMISVTSNQPINGTGDGDESPDWEITGPFTLNLRAERASGHTRIYTITIETTDLYGNTTLTPVEVSVP